MHQKGLGRDRRESDHRIALGGRESRPQGEGGTVGRSPHRELGPDLQSRSTQANLPEGNRGLLETGVRKRVSLRSPVRETRTPGLFYAERFETVFREAGQQAPVTIIPDTGHIDLTLKPIAVQAAVAAVDRLVARANLKEESKGSR